MNSRAPTTAVTACSLPHCFNLAQSAGRLCEFAAVLTALTFSAIIFLAGRDRQKHRSLEDTLIMFLAAFISLALATYLFTAVAAEENASYRAAFESFSASLALSIALQLLFLGITQLMRDHEFLGVARFTAGAGQWVVALTIFLFMSLTAINAVGLYWSTNKEFESMIAWACTVMSVVLVLWLIGLATIPRLRVLAQKKMPATAWGAIQLGLVSGAGVLSALWAEQGSDTGFPQVGFLALMVLLLGVTMIFATQLRAAVQLTDKGL